MKMQSTQLKLANNEFIMVHWIKDSIVFFSLTRQRKQLLTGTENDDAPSHRGTVINILLTRAEPQKRCNLVLCSNCEWCNYSIRKHVDAMNTQKGYNNKPKFFSILF